MRLINADDLKDWSEIVPLTDDGGIDINDFEEKLESMPTVNSWKEVYDELTKVNLLCGRYDASHAKDHYMYGVELVMEIIAYHAGVQDEFNDMFSKNMVDSEKRAERKMKYKLMHMKRKEKKNESL